MKSLPKVMLLIAAFILSYFLVMVVLHFLLGANLEIKPAGTAETNVNTITVR